MTRLLETEKITVYHCLFCDHRNNDREQVLEHTLVEHAELPEQEERDRDDTRESTPQDAEPERSPGEEGDLSDEVSQSGTPDEPAGDASSGDDDGSSGEQQSGADEELSLTERRSQRIREAMRHGDWMTSGEITGEADLKNKQVFYNVKNDAGLESDIATRDNPGGTGKQYRLVTAVEEDDEDTAEEQNDAGGPHTGKPEPIQDREEFDPSEFPGEPEPVGQALLRDAEAWSCMSCDTVLESEDDVIEHAEDEGHRTRYVAVEEVTPR